MGVVVGATTGHRTMPVRGHGTSSAEGMGMTTRDDIGAEDYREIFAAAASQMEHVDPGDYRVIFAAAAQVYAAQISGRGVQRPGGLGEEGECAFRAVIASLSRIFRDRHATRPVTQASTEPSPAYGHRRLA
jgi:hypothetical protein